MIKNIIFDIGAVLVDFNPEKVFSDMGLPAEEVEILLKNTALSPLWAELDRGVLDKEQVFEQMKQNIPQIYHSDADRFFHKEILKTVVSFDYSANWLKTLKERGYKVYLLTNYPDWMFDEHFKNTFTFSEFTDGKVVSGKVKLIKPDSRIYSAILNKYNLIPDECVFIDDREENIKGAENMGIHGIQFKNHADTVSKLETLLQKN